MIKKKIKLCYILITIIIFISTNCFNPFSPQVSSSTGENNPINPDTPDKVLINLTLSYRLLDIDLYLYCLDSSSFIFHFDPEDEGINTYLSALGITQYQWGFQEEKNSTEVIFNAMKEIGETIVPVFIGSGIYFVDSSNAIIVRQYSFDPPVIQGEIVQGRAIFYMKKFDDIWKITEWRDMVE